MISIEEAQRRILELVSPLTDTETVRLQEAWGRVLAEDVSAPFDVPPLANSAMDGYAIRAQDTASRVALKVVAEVPAGTYHSREIGPGEAARIMTGAPLPPGTDTVIPQEKVERHGEYIHCSGPLPVGANVRLPGEDMRKGEKVLSKGTRIRPQEMGILSSLGFSTLSVFRQPRVALLSTGNEVVEPGAGRRPGQIYDSNRFSLWGLLQEMHLIPLDFGIVPDRKEELRERLLAASAQADAVLTSGGVSVGSYDLVYEVLA
ncbi:MAG: molybdopterin molybdenumtransferase MoeA, partial [Nitrospinota bacterium]